MVINLIDKEFIKVGPLLIIWVRYYTIIPGFYKKTNKIWSWRGELIHILTFFGKINSIFPPNKNKDIDFIIDI